MPKKARQIMFFIGIVCLAFLVSGCTWLKRLDSRVGEMFFSATPTPGMLDGYIEEKLPKIDAGGLTRETKDKIDEWLTANNLNRYGDAFDTMYSGGTPLFSEVTGESIDRFEYILRKHPDILNKIKNIE